jgi:general nucleoside transport system ATP-binding protein
MNKGESVLSPFHSCKGVMMYKIEMLGITKRFGTLVANDHVDLQVKPQEIHAILGENGAGKSTLMSILFGLYQPDEGEIKIDGQVVSIQNPNDANRLNIGMVHQHFKLVETFSVIDNIILGVEETGFLNKIKYDDATKKLEALIEKYHLNLNIHELIYNLTVGQQQRVEILKMLYRDADILIFDEPTAVLTPQEIHELMNIMKNFVKEGKTILLITHKLDEIKQVADRTTILRRGKMVGVVDVNSVSTQEMADLMVGRAVSFDVKKTPFQKGNVLLEVRKMTVKNHQQTVVHDVSFKVHEGEILGIAGIDGNGQSECVYALAGMMPMSSGDIVLQGQSIKSDSVKMRYLKGISHIPEDRQKYGVVLDFDLQSNLVIQNFDQVEFQSNNILKRDVILAHAETLIDQFDIRSEQGPTTIVRSMSGGNQQKAIVAREMSKAHEVLIAVQPTRGLDVGAIEYIHEQLLKEREEKKGIVLFSLELDEIMKLSDRILVMYEGEIVGEFDPKTVTQETLGLYMSGAKRL